MITIVKTALLSIWRNKLTSFLAILGVVIGVASVSTLVSVGQGLKNDVSSLISGLGTNVIAVIAGKIDTTSSQSMNQGNPADFLSGDILTLDDVNILQAMPGIEVVAPMTLVSGELNAGAQKATPTLVGTTPNILQAMQVISLEKGNLFASGSKEKVIILSHSAAEKLFGNANALGQNLQLGKSGEFKVIGVLAESKASAAFASDLNNLAAIPFDTATVLNKGQVRIMRIIIKAKDNADIKAEKESIKATLLASHKGDENFTVVTQDDMLDLFSQFLNMATAMVSAIAAISIVVGGIGIMNIMLVTVTERTREIGIRKAVGATNRAILFQFLMESMVITLLGGLIGLGMTIVASIVIKSQTPLTPAITWSVLWLAVGGSALIGIIFGLIPALRAARKDPIEALRYE